MRRLLVTLGYVPSNKGKTSGSRVAYLAKQAGVSINSFIRTAVEKQIAAML